MKTEYHDMTLRDIMPNFRCIATTQTFVEIPTAYSRFISDQLPQELREIIRRTIQTLCKKYGRSGHVYNELIDDGHTKQAGYLIPLDAWDFAANQKVKNWKTFTSENKPWKEVKQ